MIRIPDKRVKTHTFPARNRKYPGKAVFGTGFLFLWVCLALLFSSNAAFGQDAADYVGKAWAASGARDFPGVYRITDICIEKFSSEADSLAVSLSAFPSKDKQSSYGVMNDVATCYFIKAEALVKEASRDILNGECEKGARKAQAAERVFKTVVEKYPFAQAWDPRGWFWSIREASEKTIKKIDLYFTRCKIGEIRIEDPVPLEEEKNIVLHDAGTEFPVDYDKYGEFKGAGTENYTYIINDPIGLSAAVGEGIYPNTSSVKFDPYYIKVKKKLGKIDHWKILNSRDYRSAFYKWNFSPEPPGVRQFYIADILERSGLIKQALKAYYAVLVQYPSTVGWTYWQTPWYIGKVALYRIQFLLKAHPELNLELKGASIEVKNGFDNDIRNDIFIVDPGRLVKRPYLTKFCSSCRKERALGKPVSVKGKGPVKLFKYESGDWRLVVEGKPFVVKAVTYSPTQVGESPDNGTLADWTGQDTNNNGSIDAPYESWVDKNDNGLRDADEDIVGDFALLKAMGANAIRLYHQPYAPDKKLLGQMYEKYGIYIILGDFLGKYAIGSGATWEEGTDYDNPAHQKNMLESVRKMVQEYKDEPYVLMWMLGNENVYGLGCNADKNPGSFFAFANRAARLITSLDPFQRPVLIVSGDVLFLDVFARECPDVDIFGTNAYRGQYGFFSLWQDVKTVAGKPVIITEYGAPAYSAGYTEAEGERYQARYHRNAWMDIEHNSCGYGAGNALGGIAFEFLDEWWKRYEPLIHDRTGQFAGPFLDGFMHEEWLGLVSQGDGRDSPFKRKLRKAYFTYKELWNKKDRLKR